MQERQLFQLHELQVLRMQEESLHDLLLDLPKVQEDYVHGNRKRKMRGLQRISMCQLRLRVQCVQTENVHFLRN